MVDLSPYSSEMLRNYAARYEAGGVQRVGRLRFVDARGRACVAAAFTGARTVEEFAESEACAAFPGSHLETLSRLFEAGEITPDEIYARCLLELARRSHATARKSRISCQPSCSSSSRISARPPGAPTAART